MPLWTPPGPCFQSIASNFSGRPAFNAGTIITAGASNTKGSYTQVMAASAVTFDAYAMEILIGGCQVSADNNQCFLDIGIDESNTSNYTIIINNLQASNAAFFDGGDGAAGSIGGLGYYFPIRIKEGTQIGVRGQTDDNSTRSPNILIKLFGNPKYPELARAGSYVTTFGANTTTTRGAAITPGQAAEGSWVDVSGADTTLSYWYWEMGMGMADTGTGAARIYFNDLSVGDASNKQLVLADIHFGHGITEAITKRSMPGQGYFEAPAGVRPYVRSQCSTTPAANMNTCVYAVGG